jgi:eukaryotic-like serine/threonine-protein kinase
MQPKLTPPNATAPRRFRIGDLEIDIGKAEVTRGDEKIALPKLSFDLLCALIDSAPAIVTNEELLQQVWPGLLVSPESVSQRVKLLRTAIGDDSRQPRYILGVRGRGYRLIPVVERLADSKLPASDFTNPPINMPSATDTESGHEAIAAADDGLERIPKSIMRRWAAATAGSIVVVGLALGGWLLHTPSPHMLTEKDSIVLADFTNTTGDAVFDDTLRQGLAVQLEQSPFLSLISEERTRQTLRMMDQPSDATITPGIAREICQRTRSAAVLDGFITQIGTQYSLILKAVNCSSGESLASTESQASDKNHILDALGKAATEIRTKLGESLSTTQKYDTPLVEATTPSLEALKAYSSGNKVLFEIGSAAAVPFFKHATELDPNFAMAYAWLGRVSSDVGEFSSAADYTRKAYELRDRVSEREKYFISASYFMEVTGDFAKARENCELWVQAYPRDFVPRDFLSGIIYPTLAQYEKAIPEATEAIRLEPDNSIAYAILMFAYLALNRLDEATATYGQASRRNLDWPDVHGALYQIAFLRGDTQAMTRQETWAAGQPGVEDMLLDDEAATAAYSGRLVQAREFSRQAAASAGRTGQKETAAGYEAEAALREALFGNAAEARQRAAMALGHSTGRNVQLVATLSLIIAGDATRVEALASDWAKRLPEDTIVKFNFLPAIHAQLALSRNDPAKAVEVLQASSPYELGELGRASFMPALFVVYLRGDAYLAAHEGSEAAAEFQKILDHPGIVVNEPIGALAHLGLARAYRLQGDTSKARAAYQEFLTLWKDADPDIPILRQAKSDYAALR